MMEMPTLFSEAKASFAWRVRASWRHIPGQQTRLCKRGQATLHAWLAPEGSATIWILTGYTGLEFGSESALKETKVNSGGPWGV